MRPTSFPERREAAFLGTWNLRPAPRRPLLRWKPGGVGPATVTKLVHQGWLGMMYQNVEKVRKALEDNKALVTSTFTKLLAAYAGCAESEAEGNADTLYNRAIDSDSHPVHAVDALEAILPELMK